MGESPAAGALFAPEEYGAATPAGAPACYACVVVDIPTRALATPFTYAVPRRLAGEVAVGCCVLVPFAHRPAVGYVLRLEACVRISPDTSTRPVVARHSQAQRVRSRSAGSPVGET